MSDFGLKKLQKTIWSLRIPASDPATTKFLAKTNKNPDNWKANGKSPEYGFFKIRRLLMENPMDRIKYLNVRENITDKFTIRDRLFRIRGAGHMFGAIRRMSSQYRKLKANHSVITKIPEEIDSSALWDSLKVYAFDKWGIKGIGFTQIPHEFVIRDRHIFYKYALVFIDEMRKPFIDDAPQGKAGFETFRIYNHLGQAVLDIGQWLRKRGIRCQPNHPLGGLVSYVPLAGKAGLGWQGMNGLLITPEFGQRQRIAAIYLDLPFFRFTDSTEHQWIEKYCDTCKICQKECPPDAIQNTKTIYNTDIETIGRMALCIDPIKCHPQFAKMAGCSICIKVCPFSQSSGIYKILKEKFTLNRPTI